MQEAYETQEYLVLLIPLFLAMYFEKNLQTMFPRRFSLLLWGMMFNAAAQISLHILGIRSLEKMLNITAAAVALICVVAIVSLVQYDYRNKGYRTILSVIAMLVLLSGEIVNLFMNILIILVQIYLEQKNYLKILVISIHLQCLIKKSL